MVGVKRLVLVALIVFAAIAATTRGVGTAKAITCSSTVYAPVTSGSNVRGKATDSCSFTVCLQGKSENSQWSAPFACLSHGAGGPFYSSWYAGCGFAVAFRTVIHDGALPPGVYLAGPSIVC
jgi:hypothetical protein